jgi:DNA-directed RNA polymerase specialized sigma24 family protein
LLWRSRAEYEPGHGRVRPWVLGILRLRAIVGRPARPELHGAAEPTDDGGGRRLRELLEALPRSRREIIVLAYYGELTVEEIADQLDLPPHCVNNRMCVALDAEIVRLVGGKQLDVQVGDCNGVTWQIVSRHWA